MTLLRLSAALACATTAFAGQIPIQQPADTQSAIDAIGKHGLISSSKLQDDISIKELLHRAKELSKIADLGIPEYNHPTRVIGSKGTRVICPL